MPPERIVELATDDFEDDSVCASSAILLARFGKPEQLNRLIESKRAAAKKSKRAFAAWRSLASIYWQAELYDQAVKAYDKAIQAGEGQPPGVMATVHYNKACSQALGKKVDDAFKTLDAALEIAGTNAQILPTGLLATDRDIESLRKDKKRFAELLEKHGRSIPPSKAAPGASPTSRPAAHNKDDGDDDDDDDDDGDNDDDDDGNGGGSEAQEARHKKK